MHRFFVSPEVLARDEVILEGHLAHRIARVLRLKVGHDIVLFDGGGLEHEVRLEEVGPGEVRGRIVQRRRGQAEPRTRLVLYQSLIKGERFDWVLEKGTELGVSVFVPLICHRNVVRPAGERAGRAERWRRVVVEAAEQCGRGVVPEVAPVADLETALSDAQGLRILPWEGERSLGLREVLRQAAAETQGADRPIVSVFVGPEGGFTEEEVDAARKAGVRMVSLGPRILRSETAGIAAAAVILYELGD
jgi:16S rRNA (uracil1498-N3)-methyltransferase